MDHEVLLRAKCSSAIFFLNQFETMLHIVRISRGRCSGETGCAPVGLWRINFQKGTEWSQAFYSDSKKSKRE